MLYDPVGFHAGKLFLKAQKFIVLCAISFSVFALSASFQDTRQLQREKSSNQNINSQKRTALVIGNSTSKTSLLTTNEYYSADVADALKGLGFEVISGIKQPRALSRRLVRR